MPAPGANLPPTCNVLGWVVFWPGYHKDELYTPQRCELIPVNFRLLADRTPHAKLGDELPGTSPRGKLGHDPQQLLAQRLKESSGLISVGDITRCDAVPGYPGHVEIDVRNVPTRLVGGEIAAGRYNSGSVELKGQVRDPRDPSRFLDGPVLTAIAFLGEEPPALNECHPDLQARTKPRATFDDGSPVPPNPEPPPEMVAAMSDVMRYHAQKFSGEYRPERRSVRIGGREYAAEVVCFSDFNPEPPEAGRMTPEEIKAKLQAAGKPPEEIDAIMAALGAPMTAAAGAVPPPAPATNPTMSDTGAGGAAKPPEKANFAATCRKMADAAKTPEEKAMYSAFADEMEAKDKQFADMTKRVGELQASADADRKTTEEAQMAAFSAEVARDVDGEYRPDGQCVRPGLSRKLAPVERDRLKKFLVEQYGPQVKAFSSSTDRVKAYQEKLAGYAGLPDDKRLAQPPGPAVKTAPTAATNPVIAAMTAKGTILDRTSPALAKQYREGAAAAK